MKTIAWWSPNPDEIRIDLELPSRVKLDELSRRMMSPAYSAGKQSLYREAFRVEELLYNKQRDVQLALGRCVPVILSTQDRYLRTGALSHRSNVSLQDLASTFDTRPSSLAVAFEGTACEAQGKVIPFDVLIGPRKAAFGEKIGFISPDKLIPTEAMRDRRAFDEYVQVFEKRRQEILDPVPVLPEPDNEETGYVLQGNHRAAAAYRTGSQIRIVIIEKMEQARKHVKQGVAGDLVKYCNHDQFLAQCRSRANLHGFRESGWQGYIES